MFAFELKLDSNRSMVLQELFPRHPQNDHACFQRPLAVIVFYSTSLHFHLETISPDSFIGHYYIEDNNDTFLDITSEHYVDILRSIKDHNLSVWFFGMRESGFFMSA